VKVEIFPLVLTTLLFSLPVHAGFITNTVTVDSTEWAQANDFQNLSWNDIDAVCSGGSCSGTLNGFNMSGWTWASPDETNALFNSYLADAGVGGSNLLSGANDFYTEVDSAWGPAFFADFDSTSVIGGFSIGGFPNVLTGEFLALTSLERHTVNISNYVYGVVGPDGVYNEELVGPQWADLKGDIGGIFYRQIPLPSTIFLIGLGLLSFGVSRKRAI
jgi:hypothetical protein